MTATLTAAIPTAATPTTATLTTATPTTAVLEGWHPDPEGRHRLRYHDGRTFTEHATHWGPVPCAGCSHVG